MGTGISPTLSPSGSNDVTQINSALKTYQTVKLSTGHWLIYGEILMNTGNVLLGSGPGTLLDYGPNYVGDIYVLNVSNIEIGNFNMQGTPLRQGILIESSASSQTNFYVHDVIAASLGGTCFTINVDNNTISNVIFSRCQANSPDYMGFTHRGSGTLKNVIYYKCSTFNCGTTGQFVWTVGFDGADDTLTVNGLYYIACSANGAWESDWHFEGVATKKGVVFLDCNAQYAGQKPSTFDNQDGSKGVIYGAGYLLGNFTSGRDDGITNGITATGDHNFICDVWGFNGNTKYSLQGGQTYNQVFGRTATVIRVNQANCVGIDIYNSVAKTHDVILYSSDGNALPVTVTLSDGTTVSTSSVTDFVVQLAIPVGSNSGFVVGSNHTAAFQATVIPAGLAYTIEVWLGLNSSIKAVTSGQLPFTSTGTAQDISVSLVMPSTPGQYYTYIDMYLGSTKLNSYVSTTPLNIVSGNVSQPVWT